MSTLPTPAATDAYRCHMAGGGPMGMSGRATRRKYTSARRGSNGLRRGGTDGDSSDCGAVHIVDGLLPTPPWLVPWYASGAACDGGGPGDRGGLETDAEAAAPELDEDADNDPAAAAAAGLRPADERAPRPLLFSSLMLHNNAWRTAATGAGRR